MHPTTGTNPTTLLDEKPLPKGWLTPRIPKTDAQRDEERRAKKVKRQAKREARRAARR
jgi:hypothetical protein